MTVISKTDSSAYIGGTINNSDLDVAIDQDMTPQQYSLGVFDTSDFVEETQNHSKGTIIYFEKIKETTKNTIPYLRTLIALYFRLSLIDESFNIYVNDQAITLSDLQNLSDNTEFLWNINGLEDPYINQLSSLEPNAQILTSDLSIKGFIASVKKPVNLKIRTTDEKVGIDLFVNGRLREKNLMKHIPTARITESYLYGQIHFDELDEDGTDRFTSSREGVVESDEKYKALLGEMKRNIIPAILNQWDRLRLDRGKDGDDESSQKTPKQRRAISLFNLTSDEYIGDNKNAPEKDELIRWIKQLRSESEFNIPAYTDCFLSENLMRKYITHQRIKFSSVKYRAQQTMSDRIKSVRSQETGSKKAGNINIPIRQGNSDLSYLGMASLTRIIDTPGSSNNLNPDAQAYKPMRDGVAHTALLTPQAKKDLRLCTITSKVG